MKIKIIQLVGIVFSVFGLALVYLVYTLGLDTKEVSANPDYICIKDVNRSCDIVRNDENCEWHKAGELSNLGYEVGGELCEGKKVTQVAYYHLRTNCEIGYTNQRKVGGGGGDSGRHSADFAYGTSTCNKFFPDEISPQGKKNGNK